MTELALRLQIFIASSNDVIRERQALEDAVLEGGREVAGDRLLLKSFRWEKDFHPAYGPPGAAIAVHLNRSDLVVVIVGKRVGDGTLDELGRAKQLAQLGRVDNIFLYFQRSPEASAELQASARDLRQSIESTNSALFFEYGDTTELAELFKRHLRNWLLPWRRVPEICEYALQNSSSRATPADLLSESRVARLAGVFDPFAHPKAMKILGENAVEHYQRHGVDGADIQLSLEALQDPRGAQETLSMISMDADVSPGAYRQLSLLMSRPFISEQPLVRGRRKELFFAAAEWYWFYCAVGLLDSIERNNSTVVVRRPYVNDVHQYVSGIFKRMPVERQKLVIERLVTWLSGQTANTAGQPIARNFAAYVLGMVGAEDAQDALSDAALYDNGKDVRTYAIAALGKLRARRHLNTVVELFSREEDSSSRIMISQAIARIVGIGRFEL